MKLTIEIPKEVKQVFDNAESNNLKGGFYDYGGIIGRAIQNGIPLDEYKAENNGEWKEVVTGRFPNGEKRIWHYECSACSKGEPFCPINMEHWDFCPNCGADMRNKNNC